MQRRRVFGPRLIAISPIVSNAAWLVATVVVSSGLGAAFWWIAARTSLPSEVGTAAAAISAMTLCGTVGMMGIGTYLIAELPRRRADKLHLILRGMWGAAMGGGVIAILFSFVAPAIWDNYSALRSSFLIHSVFVIGSALTAATLVLDSAFIADLRGSAQLVRNGMFAVAKLVFLGIAVVLAIVPATGIINAWVAGILVSLVLGVGFQLHLFSGGKEVLPRLRPPRLRLPWSQIRTLMAHHALNLALQATGQLMPIVVAGSLTLASNAYFYTAAMIAYLITSVPVSLATAVFATGRSASRSYRTDIRFSASIALAVAVVANVFVPVFGPIALGVFGEGYVSQGMTCLQILSLQAFTFTVREHFVTMRRIQGIPAAAVPFVIFGTALKIAGAIVGARGGLVGLSWGILAGSVVEAAIMTAPLVRELRRRSPGVSVKCEMQA